MKQTNLSIFIPHQGCKFTCSFCNQRYISGKNSAPTFQEVEQLLNEQLPILKMHNQRAEIAFFGGSFTAIDRDYMLELLKIAHKFATNYPQQYCGIRCSTRPDCIDDEVLQILKQYGMTAIELGAQSMNDDVLSANNRGHSEVDVEKSAWLIKSYEFELGLQMMTGLYLDKPEFCIDTAKQFIKLKADTVRVYPTVILENTTLGALYKSGEYKSFTFEETVLLCTELLKIFESAKIPVIRLGLHASETVETEMISGNYHPALREICESKIWLEDIFSQMKKLGGNRFVIYTDKSNISKIIGHKKANKQYLETQGITFKMKEQAGEKLRVQKV